MIYQSINIFCFDINFSRAPIKFPLNEGEELREQQQEDQARRLLEGIAAKQSLSHPYEQLSLKTGVRDLKLLRFVGPDNAITEPAFKSLANHARKVLNNKFQQQTRSDDFYDQQRINRVDHDFDDYNGGNSDEVKFELKFQLSAF